MPLDYHIFHSVKRGTEGRQEFGRAGTDFLCSPHAHVPVLPRTRVA